jgi:hypothetical protein
MQGIQLNLHLPPTLFTIARIDEPKQQESPMSNLQPTVMD